MDHRQDETRRGGRGRQGWWAAWPLPPLLPACRPLPGLLLPGLLLLAGCVGSPGEGPLEFYRQVSGEALDGRAMPPGLDDRYPNLANVPQRPARGEASAREALSRALADYRAQSRSPLPSDVPLPDPPATPGAAEVPRQPPAPARLAAAPPIGPSPSSEVLRGDTADPGPQAPAAPPAELLAPPAPDLSAPPPPPALLRNP
ncbi:hypothetical protein LPC08_03825 [Roseomonas sp. OT10]|uniref:hypothetical protein n=1 Tax=Roseomonas cutis TaxID=2897332 RepID=UPI001E64525C|nr:hypothetical protein [Roseomonas sp. OT10]UFN49786.1 hypothetical protein LPC08_03825 [Roseomonas sp. OT10]